MQHSICYHQLRDDGILPDVEFSVPKKFSAPSHSLKEYLGGEEKTELFFDCLFWEFLREADVQCGPLSESKLLSVAQELYRIQNPDIPSGVPTSKNSKLGKPTKAVKDLISRVYTTAILLLEYLKAKISN